MIDPPGRGGVRAHLRERTRTGGIEPATPPPPEVVQFSAGRDGAVRPPWIPRNRPRAALAGALRRSAAAYEVDARSLQPTCRGKATVSVGGGKHSLRNEVNKWQCFIYLRRHGRAAPWRRNFCCATQDSF